MGVHASYKRKDTLGNSSVCSYGQCLMGWLTNQGLGKNKVGKLETRNLGWGTNLSKQAKSVKNSFDPCESLPVGSHYEQISWKWNGAYKGPCACQPSRCFLNGTIYKVDIDSGNAGLNKKYFLSQADLAMATVLSLPKVNANASLPILFYSLGLLAGHLVTCWLAWIPYNMEVFIR